VNAEIRIVAVVVKRPAKHVVVLKLIANPKLKGTTVRLKYLCVGQGGGKDDHQVQHRAA
jgi:hypothetical protein